MRAIVSIVLGVWLAACAGARETAPADPAPAHDLVAAGRAIAETRCIGCHAIGVSGESALPAAPPLRTLSERYPVSALEEAFAEGVLVGHPAMPEFRMTPDEIEALIAYLETIQERRGG
ncbi:MAG: c-type cytochrome [Alphaproteobacteria bacterium]|nr:c-type cytochrome [Alphaproteobacteria bacterium]